MGGKWDLNWQIGASDIARLRKLSDESDFSAAHGPLALRFVLTQMLDMILKPIKRSGMESWGDRRSV